MAYIYICFIAINFKSVNYEIGFFYKNTFGGAYSSDAAGVYEFEIGDAQLTFSRVNDPVNGRSMLVEGTWSKDGDLE